jgi:hypothetical protein
VEASHGACFEHGVSYRVHAMPLSQSDNYPPGDISTGRAISLFGLLAKQLT